MRTSKAGYTVPVHVINRQSAVKISTKDLSDLLEDVIGRELGRDVRVNVLLSDDEHITELNRQFLGRNEPTDVLAFPLDEETSQDDEPTFGDVVISGETALREATERNIEPERELTLYALHGILHLLGYDDRTEADRKRMRARENEILKERFP